MDQSHDACSVVGIDLSAGRGTTEIACLSLASFDSMPVLDTLKYQPVVTDAEITEAIASYRPAVVAIDAPLSLPAQVVRSLTALGPRGPEHGRLGLFSRDEHIVAMPGPPVSPYLRAAERDPVWSQLGVRPFPVSFLGGLTFRAIALLPALRTALGETPIIEVFPSGSASALGLHPRDSTTTSRVKRLTKTSPPARAALQQALSSHITGIPAVREDESEPLGADLLDALVAALTAVAYLRRTFIAIGDPAEGQIVLPRRP